jgi:hypothetical protein
MASYALQAILQYLPLVAEKYNELSLPKKIGVSMGNVLISPIFWVVSIVVVIITTIILWWANPCWIRSSEIDQNDRKCGFEQAGFGRVLLISAAIILPILYLLMVILDVFLKTTLFGIVSTIPTK